MRYVQQIWLLVVYECNVISVIPRLVLKCFSHFYDTVPHDVGVCDCSSLPPSQMLLWQPNSIVFNLWSQTLLVHDVLGGGSGWMMARWGSNMNIFISLFKKRKGIKSISFCLFCNMSSMVVCYLHLFIDFYNYIFFVNLPKSQ